MPTYVYRDQDSGETVEMVMTVAEKEAREKGGYLRTVDGRLFKRLIGAGFIGTPPPSCWPMKSDSLGVHPDQAREVSGWAAQHGVPTDFTPDGRAVLRDRAHRRRFAELRGFKDRDGGFGDPRGVTSGTYVDDAKYIAKPAIAEPV